MKNQGPGAPRGGPPGGPLGSPGYSVDLAPAPLAGPGNDFSRTSTPVVIVLCVVTFGIYMPIWFLIQRRALNELASMRKIDVSLPVLALVLFCISAALMPLQVLEVLADEEARASLALFDRMINLGSSVMVLILAFQVRRILDEHFRLGLGLPVQLSRIATLFFTIWYLQYKINDLPTPAMYQPRPLK